MSDDEKAVIDLDTLGAPLGPIHPCSYLNDRNARERACRIDDLPNGFYRIMMDFRWRRSGPLFYKPDCEGCQECKPIRIDIPAFKPNRTQRKVLNRNSDIEVRVVPPKPTDEKFELFLRYQIGRHDGTMCTEKNEFENFLYSSPLETKEFEFFLDGKIIASSIVDYDAFAVSAVYTYFDPDIKARSLGTFAILYLIAYSHKSKYKLLYMGYFVESCRKMNYKLNFRPCEVLEALNDRNVYRRYE